MQNMRAVVHQVLNARADVTRNSKQECRWFHKKGRAIGIVLVIRFP